MLNFKLNFKAKKLIPALLLLLVVVTLVLSPIGAKKAEAANWLSSLLKAGVKYVVGGVIHTTLRVVAFLTGLLSQIAATILALAGMLLDKSIEMSLTNNMGNIYAVQAGWTITRDLANLAFIFILLYISIATILQVSGYGMKQLLVTVIIVALLVNFSLVITKVVIDFTNVLALEFYGAMHTSDASISEVIVAGMDLQGIKNMANTPADKIGLHNIILVNIFATFFYLMAAWVFFDGVYLFITRMVAFIFLMVLAPVAFVAKTLPKTHDLSVKWWKTLFEQSMVGPAYLFLLYVVVKIINSGALKVMAAGVGAGAGSGVDDLNLSVAIMLNFALLIGLMWGASKLAKEVGGQISGSALGWASAGRSKIMGMTKKAVTGGYVPKRIKRAVAGAAGRGAEALQEGEGRGAKFLRRIPLATTTLGKIGATGRKGVGAYEKELEGMSVATLKNRAAGKFTSNAERAAIVNMLAQKGDLKAERGFKAEHVQAGLGVLKSRGMNPKVAQALRWQYATDASSRAGAISGVANSALGFDKPTGVIKSDAVEKLKLDDYFGASVPSDVRNAMYQNFGTGHVQSIMNRGDDAHNKFFDSMKSDSKGFKSSKGHKPGSVEHLTEWLESDQASGGMGNAKLAAWARSKAGQNILRSQGFIGSSGGGVAKKSGGVIKEQQKKLMDIELG